VQPKGSPRRPAAEQVQLLAWEQVRLLRTEQATAMVWQKWLQKWARAAARKRWRLKASRKKAYKRLACTWRECTWKEYKLMRQQLRTAGWVRTRVYPVAVKACRMRTTPATADTERKKPMKKALAGRATPVRQPGCKHAAA